MTPTPDTAPTRRAAQAHSGALIAARPAVGAPGPRLRRGGRRTLNHTAKLVGPRFRLVLAGPGRDAGRRGVRRRRRAGPLGCPRGAHRPAAAGHERAVNRGLCHQAGPAAQRAHQGTRRRPAARTGQRRRGAATADPPRRTQPRGGQHRRHRAGPDGDRSPIPVSARICPTSPSSGSTAAGKSSWTATCSSSSTRCGPAVPRPSRSAAPGSGRM